MSGAPARFWGQPIRYLRWAAHEKPAIFWSCVMGGLGPATFVFIPPMRRYFGDQDPPRIPLTYPGTYANPRDLYPLLDYICDKILKGDYAGFGRCTRKTGKQTLNMGISGGLGTPGLEISDALHAFSLR
ncbi:NADH dehydrogenase [Fonsecaea erecta]|uniref:NADH dehydrogenase n=1 Tax=Fonsecaea erecta TaxID=1367422 RepID=A0A178ZBF0_9EURO|nr:NADH dehydrogenase [Fonsecaea erecta]OAP57107.1 NADH dehydrogenase [Fonsecaea erecta]